MIVLITGLVIGLCVGVPVGFFYGVVAERARKRPLTDAEIQASEPYTPRQLVTPGPNDVPRDPRERVREMRSDAGWRAMGKRGGAR
jgi:hypothetical protein